MDMIKNRANQKKKWKITIPISLIILSLCLNLAAWFSSSFCNYYVMHIFPVWVETYGRLTGMFSFSVGGDHAVSGSFTDRNIDPVGGGSSSASSLSAVVGEAFFEKLQSDDPLDFWHCMCDHDAELLFAVPCISDQ